ncbi:hypothetical protein [Psychromicrobium sp. YIM B11713]|uniref:hypothetical protein n=1 Tax=Psychromicrobium sp. YIM B11713 TaxID=3145233 RepID=UPI00374F2A37
MVTSESPAMETLAGHNRISTAALTSVTQAAAAECFRVQISEIRVSFSDSAGRLAISLATPITVPPLTSLVSSGIVRSDGETAALTNGQVSIWDRTIAAKKYILDKVCYLTGSDVARVDIRITGVRNPQSSKNTSGRVQ